ncbi:MAG: ComEC/Rec2 family competence protein [Anaerolineales bacterium]|nr:ComEC/Rec2 family competence protein [Anaerolineales bacterium]
MPLLWLSLAFLSGILLADLLNWRTAAWLLLAGLGLVYLLFSRRLAQRLSGLRRIPMPAAPVSNAVLFVSLCLGAARYQVAQPNLHPGAIAWYNDQPLIFVIEGIITAPVDERDAHSNLRVQVEQIHPEHELLFTPVKGLLLAHVPPHGDWRYGDRVRLQGWLITPEETENFSYREYLARQGIYTQFTCSTYQDDSCVLLLERDQGSPLISAIYALRSKALQTVYHLFPDPEASLLAGILLGMESGIPEDVQTAFQDTGTAHIIAISGFNITIIGGLFATIFLRLLGKPRRFLAAALTVIVIALYTLLVGPSAAVVRAALLGGFAIFARQLGRAQHGLNSLAIIAALMSLQNPYALWDVGFQLSFAATLGLVLYADPLQKRFLGWVSQHLPPEIAKRTAGMVGEYLLFTLAAQVTTLPVTIYHFQRLSLAGLIANPLILPAQPPVMILGGLATLLGLAFTPLGQVFAALAWPFVAYTIQMVQLLARIPSAALTLGEWSLPAVLIFYVLLFGWTLAGSKLKNQPAERIKWLTARAAAPVFLALAALVAVVWQTALTRPDGYLHLTMLDVGSGDGLLIQTPNRHNVLIDGGPSPRQLSAGLGRRLPLFQRRLDYLIVASVEDENIAALAPTVERFPPEFVLWSGPPLGTQSAQDLQRQLGQQKIPVLTAQTGQTLDLGQGALLRLLAVGSRGMVLWLEWGNFRALLPIGLDFDSQAILQEDHLLPPVTALMLAESGQASLNTSEWITRWRPQVILLSVGAGDPQGYPQPEALQAAQGYTLLRSDQNGWIELITDGQSLWVEVEKK